MRVLGWWVGAVLGEGGDVHVQCTSSFCEQHSKRMDERMDEIGERK